MVWATLPVASANYAERAFSWITVRGRTHRRPKIHVEASDWAKVVVERDGMIEEPSRTVNSQ